MTRSIRALIVAAAVTSITGLTISAPTAVAEEPDPSCAPLHLLVANGVGETEPGANPNVDAGFGWNIAVPALDKANTDPERPLLTRSYVSYKASDPSEQRVVAGQAAAVNQIIELAKKCPSQKMFLVGHGSGGQIMLAIARDIGTNKGPVKADQVAGVAVFADPTRAAGAPVFANKATSPGAVPGVKSGAESKVSGVRINTATPPDGSGPAPITSGSYGALASRVANFCAFGDLSCDIPKDAALAKVIAGISAKTSTDTSDPFKILTSAVTAIGSSLIYSGAGFVSDNLNVTSGGQISVNTNSKKTVMDRMVQASNPTANPQDALTSAITALTKIAGMGVNAAIAVGKDVINAASIAEIGAAMLGGPQAALAAVAVKLGSAVVKMITPATVTSLVTLAFKEITDVVTDNAGLVRMALDSNYWQGNASTGYLNTPVGVGGQTAAALTAEWVAAAAEDSATVVAAAATSTAKASATTTKKTGATTTAKPTPTKTVPVAGVAGEQQPAASQILAGQVK